MSDTNEFEASEGPAPEVEALPLDGWHRARGARMVAFAGYHMPIQYEGIIAEHLWTRASAGLFDVSHMGQLILSGSGLDAALEALVTADLITLAEGRQRYALLLNDAGGILDDLMIARAPMGLFLVVNGATKWDDIAHLREHLPDEIAINHLADRALLAVQGPRAAAALAELVPGVRRLAFMEAGSFLWGLEPLWISRSGYTGEDGFEISLPAEHAAAFADALCADPQVRPIGLGARDSLRLEAGLPLYGHDLDPGINPVEAALTFALSRRRRAEGGFPGADRILAQLASGPARRRVGLEVAGRMPVREGALLYVGTEPVGEVTSGGFAPSVDAPIAMAYVAAAFAAPGTPLEAEVRGKRIAVTVTALPFIPHTYHRKGTAQ
ncbi:MAG: glycine cleavage system aminomethyltransferase GcvT [Chakrabartia sp.]